MTIQLKRITQVNWSVRETHRKMNDFTCGGKRRDWKEKGKEKDKRTSTKYCMVKTRVLGCECKGKVGRDPERNPLFSTEVFLFFLLTPFLIDKI